MDDANEGMRKALLVLLVIIIAGASFYLGIYIAHSEVKADLNANNQSATLISSSSLFLITSPEGNAEDKIVELIQSANQSIEVEMYIFTNSKLSDALINAKKRGVEVKLILGSTEGEDIEGVITLLTGNGIEVRNASKEFRTMHSKIMVVDGAIVLIGSHNWSQSAMFYNREISVIIHDSTISKQVQNIFYSDWSKSTSLS